jgi:hypothetical protein
MTTRLVTWLVDGGPSGEREVIAYAAGSLVGIAVAALVLTFVVGVGVLGT